MKKLLHSEKLALMFEYYKDLITPRERANLEKFTKLDFNRNYHFFAYVLDLYGYNDFVRVLSDKKFKENLGKSLYRGAKSIDHHANLLCDYDYHYGYGVFGNGIYLTDDYALAVRYAQNETDNVLTTKFSGKIQEGSKVLENITFVFHLYNTESKKEIDELASDYKDSADFKMLKVIIKFYQNLKKKSDRKLFIDMLKSDTSILPIILGYDAMNNNGLIIFNRSKLSVSKSEFKRITGFSKNYKDGTINFDKKSASEFLLE